MPEVLSTRPQAVLKTEGTVFTIRTLVLTIKGKSKSIKLMRKRRWQTVGVKDRLTIKKHFKMYHKTIKVKNKSNQEVSLVLFKMKSHV